MDEIWLAITAGVKGIVDFILSAYGKGALVAGLLCLAIWALQEWVIGPIFKLPLLRKGWPIYAAVRPAISVLLSTLCFHHLHEVGTIDFGAGPTGWGIDAIYGAVGGALTMPLHDILKSRAPALTDTKPVETAP